jgi:hypothetical protein
MSYFFYLIISVNLALLENIKNNWNSYSLTSYGKLNIILFNLECYKINFTEMTVKL